MAASVPARASKAPGRAAVPIGSVRRAYIEVNCISCADCLEIADVLVAAGGVRQGSRINFYGDRAMALRYLAGHVALPARQGQWVPWTGALFEEAGAGTCTVVNAASSLRYQNLNAAIKGEQARRPAPPPRQGQMCGVY